MSSSELVLRKFRDCVSVLEVLSTDEQIVVLRSMKQVLCSLEEAVFERARENVAFMAENLIQEAYCSTPVLWNNLCSTSDLIQSSAEILANDDVITDSLYQQLTSQESFSNFIEPQYTELQNANSDVIAPCSVPSVCNTAETVDFELRTLKTPKFQCVNCSKNFPSNKRLLHHFAKCKHFKCRFCDDPTHFRLDVQLKQHVRIIHGKKYRKSFDCHLCIERFNCQSARYHHILCNHRDANYVCKQCGYVIDAFSSYQFHLQMHVLYSEWELQLRAVKITNEIQLSVPTVQQSDDVLLEVQNESALQVYKCEKCNFSTKYRQSCWRHFKKMHAADEKLNVCKKVICGQCSKEYSSKSALLEHERVKHSQINSKTFQCSICSKTFTLQRILKRHVVEVHDSNNKSLKCEKCGTIYKHLPSFKRHFCYC